MNVSTTILIAILSYVGLCICDNTETTELSENVSYHEPPEVELIDEENDGKILVDVIASIAEWKDRQQRKLLHYLFHRQKRDEEVVCYGELGCFRDEGPFNYLDMLPSPPEEINTVFYLFTRKNNEQPQILDNLNVTTINTSHFNVSNPTKIIIHGFGSSCTKIWPREMRLSFLQVEDVNVICVDWAAGAVDPNYVRAAVNTRLVGKQVAALINKLSEESGVTINNNTHLVGFSLGAHVSGFVGKELPNLSRITGLDPAGPLFEGYSANVRLDKTDADYVDVIHSNGDSLIIGGLGAWEPIGHVDFYPNGGKAQRGCQNLLIGGLYDFVYSYTAKNESQSYRYLCNHRRAYKLFTDSISPKCQFTAFPCESYEKFESGQCFSCSSEAGDCGQLGYRSNLSPGRGSLYLLTREEEPFCAAQFKIKLMFTGSRQPIYTYGAIQIKLISKEGINETFTLTSNHDELLTSGAKIEKLIVSHPALSQPTEIQILYIAYEGWIYSGREVWSVEKLILSDGYGNDRSWCKEHGELLPKGVPVTVPLQLGECSGVIVPPLEKLPPNPGLPLKPGNIRPPLLTNDISKHSDILEFNIPTAEPQESRPLLVPVKPQIFSLPSPPPPHSGHANHRPLLQPFHLQGPPGAWNIVTSKPGSLPPPIHVYQSKVPGTKNTDGIEVQFGPRLPLPPINPQPGHHFPPRRRPVTNIMAVSDTEAAATLVTSTEQQEQKEETERVDHLPEAEIIVIETNNVNTNTTGAAEKPGNQSIKTDIRSDDQLTIFKVGPDNDIVRVSNDTEDNDTDTDTQTDYKLVILHKLPNGNALNLENLKTYNYEDLIKGHSSVIEDSNQEEMFDRENLEFFDVPRRVSNDKPEPYIIYQIPDKTSHIKPIGGGGAGSRPTVHPVYRPTAPHGSQVAEFNHTGSPNDTNINRPKIASPSVAITNDWIPSVLPTDRRKNGLNLNKLTELSQLAQVSINNNGPIRVPPSPSLPTKLNVQLLPSRLSSVLSHLDSAYRDRDRSMESHERYSRVGGSHNTESHERQDRERHSRVGGSLSHNTESHERQDRERHSRMGGTHNIESHERHSRMGGSLSHRQNKISPAFQPLLKNIRDRIYGRKLHGGHSGQYVMTQPYQTQVIPSSNHKYIPLLHQKKALWWQPQQQRYQFPVRPHQLITNRNSHTISSKPLTSQLTSPVNSTVLINSQSVLLGLNDSKPVYIIDLNETSQLQENVSIGNSSNEDQRDILVVYLNGTAQEDNSTTGVTTESIPNIDQLDMNVKNNSSKSFDLKSVGNQKLNDTTNSPSVNEWIKDPINEESGKYLQELSPITENIKLKPSPASGMEDKSQE